MRQGFRQTGNVATLQTGLTGAPLLVTELQANECLSEPFSVHLKMKSENANIDTAGLIGQKVSVTICLSNGAQRFFHGLFKAVGFETVDAAFAYYTAEIVPELSRMEFDRDRRIFQNLSVVEIIEQYLQRYSLVFEKRLIGAYPTREYCVQYDESPLHFLSRLMQDEGIWYFFKQTNSGCSIVLADHNAAFSPEGPQDPLVYQGRQTEAFSENAILSLKQMSQMVTQAWAVSDYNMLTPTTNLAAESKGQSGLGRWFEYPAPGTTPTMTASCAQRLANASQIAASTTCFETIRCELTAGTPVEVIEHPSSVINTNYVVQSITHTLQDETYWNECRAFRQSLPFRPSRSLKKPRISGSHSAVVVGPSDEKIWVDELGRVRVRFFWDQHSPNDSTSSCWMRVSQSWAGSSWGNVFLPRVGHEVVVSYMDGDPDRPVVTGSVYHAEEELPVDLPANKTQSILRTQSVKKSTTTLEAIKKAAVTAFNESSEAGMTSLAASLGLVQSSNREPGNAIRFEDQSDAEELYLHAQKDLTVEIEHDSSTTLYEGSETHTLEKGDRTTDIKKGKDLLKVADDREIHVGGNESHTTKGNLSQSVSKDLALDVTGNMNQTIKGDYVLKVSGNLRIEVEGDLSLTASKSLSSKSGTEHSAEAGTALSAKSGTTMDLSAGTALNAKASAQANVDGGSMLALKAGMVNIN
ncbi:MAG: type VI secretion system Vgr family protein [Burkholderiaceae bacterium]